MLTESYIAATHAVNKQSANISSNLKDVGIFQYEFQPQSIFRHGFKKSSIRPSCLGISDSHIFAGQADKAVVNVYNREKSNQEATVPFPDKISSLVYADHAAILIIGTEDGKLILWQVATGRISTSTASHLQPVSQLAITKRNDLVISGSTDSNVHVWSLPGLVSYSQSQTASNKDVPKNAPVRTFSNHRDGITALSVGTSTTSTNFAISASADNTCYIWHIESCQVLRTVLLPANCLCMTLDPAERTIYFGLENGSLQHADLFTKDSLFNMAATAPIQLNENDTWLPPSAETGAVQCITLSYDGTNVITGHKGGAVIRWDVAKHRVISELANLQQPVTNMIMLTPEGLRQSLTVAVPAVVKPRLELNIEADRGTIGIPSTYSVQVQVVKPVMSPSTASLQHDDIVSALDGTLFPTSMLDDAIQAMSAKSAGLIGAEPNGETSKIAGYKIEQLQEELAFEKKKVAWFQNHHEEQCQRHLRRVKAREALGIKKRAAYRAAEKQGLDGDAAMKLYHEIESMLDSESDEEVLATKIPDGGLSQEMETDD